MCDCHSEDLGNYERIVVVNIVSDLSLRRQLEDDGDKYNGR